MFDNLIDSHGIVDEAVLDKLKLNMRSLLESEAGKDRKLIDLCLDVIYNSNMKAPGLQRLMQLYAEWNVKNENTEDK